MIIATWNLNHAHGEWRQEAICKKLIDINADILVLTETRDSISPAGLRLVAQSSHSEELGDAQSWVSIWARPQMKAEQHTTRDAEFAASATITLTDGTPLVVFGTVLPWLGRKWRDHPSAGAAAFEAALREQQQDWQERPGVHRPALCVAGDFNQDLSEKHFYQSDKARGLLESALTDCELTALTRDPKDPVRELTKGAHACIDHICLCQQMADRQVGKSHAWSPVIGGRVLSDHPGVWVEVACM